MPSSIPVTAIVLTYNEAINIRSCLNALAPFSEVILVDSGSTDETTTIVRQEYPHVRIFANRFLDFGSQRNWAIDHTQPANAWILFVDADEVINRQLATSIQSHVLSDAPFVGYYLSAINYFLEQPIKRCTLFPSWQLRLFRVGYVRYRKEGHGQREVTEGKLGFIKEPYDHYGMRHGVAHWIARHNKYSTEEVPMQASLRFQPLKIAELFSRNALLRRRCLKRIAARIGFRPLIRFVYVYLFRLGFLDGYPGLLFCLLKLSNDIHITVKMAEVAAQSKSMELAAKEPGSTEKLPC